MSGVFSYRNKRRGKAVVTPYRRRIPVRCLVYFLTAITAEGNLLDVCLSVGLIASTKGFAIQLVKEKDA